MPYKLNEKIVFSAKIISNEYIHTPRDDFNQISEHLKKDKKTMEAKQTSLIWRI